MSLKKDVLSYLSRRFSPYEKPQEPDTILPPHCVLGAAQFDIESIMTAAQVNEAGPSQCPNNRLYVPSAVRPQVLQWGHSTQLSGHPGSKPSSAEGSGGLP